MFLIHFNLVNSAPRDHVYLKAQLSMAILFAFPYVLDIIPLARDIPASRCLLDESSRLQTR